MWVDGIAKDIGLCDAEKTADMEKVVTVDYWIHPGVPGLPSWTCVDIPKTPSGRVGHRVLAYSLGPPPCVPPKEEANREKDTNTTVPPKEEANTEKETTTTNYPGAKGWRHCLSRAERKCCGDATCLHFLHFLVITVDVASAQKDLGRAAGNRDSTHSTPRPETENSISPTSLRLVDYIASGILPMRRTPSTRPSKLIVW
eukprot:1157900-Amphidinium_carterae.1